jgi:hypothetical protein
VTHVEIEGVLKAMIAPPPPEINTRDSRVPIDKDFGVPESDLYG